MYELMYSKINLNQFTSSTAVVVSNYVHSGGTRGCKSHWLNKTVENPPDTLLHNVQLFRFSEHNIPIIYHTYQKGSQASKTRRAFLKFRDMFEVQVSATCVMA